MNAIGWIYLYYNLLHLLILFVFYCAEKSSNRAITVIVVLVFILVAVAGFAFYKKKKGERLK